MPKPLSNAGWISPTAFTPVKARINKAARRLCLAAALVSLSGNLAVAETDFDKPVRLKGAAYLDKNGCKGKLAAQDCKVSIQIDGEAAKLLYEHMTSKPDANGCIPDEKIDASGLTCYKDDDGYACHFGYHFKSGKLSASDIDC